MDSLTIDACPDAMDVLYARHFYHEHAQPTWAIYIKNVSLIIIIT